MRRYTRAAAVVLAAHVLTLAGSPDARRSIDRELPPAANAGASSSAAWDARPGVVRTDNRVFADDDGPFLALGTSLFWALWGYEHDRERLGRNLDAIASAGFDYIRVLAIVGPDGWGDRTVDPRSPEWDEHVAALTDRAYDTHGLRVQWTIFGGVSTTPTASSRASAVDRFASAIEGRHHKIFAVEMANEGWQNGFDGDAGQAEIKRLAARLRSSYPGLLATTAPRSPACAQQSAYYRDTSASLVTLHFPRGGERWNVVRAPWIAMASPCGEVPRAVSNNEPIGPYSSVEEERDPLKLAMSAAVTWASGAGAYVLHTGAGIRGGGIDDRRLDRPANVWEVQNWAALTASLACVRSVLPGDLPNWRRVMKDDHPFVPEGTADAAMSSPALARRGGRQFVALPLDIRPRTSLTVRRAATLRAVHPLTCETLTARRLRAGESITLTDPPDALIVLGR
jgi:hypothetical protein